MLPFALRKAIWLLTYDLKPFIRIEESANWNMPVSCSRRCSGTRVMAGAARHVLDRSNSLRETCKVWPMLTVGFVKEMKQSMEIERRHC